MAKIFCVFLAVLCLSACGTKQTNDGTPPQEAETEQNSRPSEQDTQSLAEEEASSVPEVPEDAEPGQGNLPVTAETAEPSVSEWAAADGLEDSSPGQDVQTSSPQIPPPLAEGISENVESEETESSQEECTLKITVGGHELLATFADNSSAEEFRDLLAQGPLTIEMEDYGGFEKVGPLGTTLSRNDTQITTKPGDVILYQGNQITIYYDTNSWDFTRLARIDDPTGLREKLGEGTVSVTFSLT